MPDRWKQVEKWRARAKEIRATADMFAVPSAKQTMLRLAQSYERLADELEELLRMHSVEKPEAC